MLCYYSLILICIFQLIGEIAVFLYIGQIKTFPCNLHKETDKEGASDIDENGQL